MFRDKPPWSLLVWKGSDVTTEQLWLWRVMHKLSGVFCFQFTSLRCKIFPLGSVFKNRFYKRKVKGWYLHMCKKHLVLGENLDRENMSVLINSSFVQDYWKFSFLTQQNQNFLAMVFDMRSSIPSTYLLRSWFRSCETWCLIPHSKCCHTSGFWNSVPQFPQL